MLVSTNVWKEVERRGDQEAFDLALPLIPEIYRGHDDMGQIGNVCVDATELASSCVDIFMIRIGWSCLNHIAHRNHQEIYPSSRKLGGNMRDMRSRRELASFCLARHRP